MPYKQKGNKARAPRDYDAESGKNRVKRGKKPAPPASESESEITASESEIESDLELEAKDVARRKVKPARKPRARPQQDSAHADIGEEADPSPSAQVSIAPALAMLFAINYRLGLSVVSQPLRSFYIPDVNALFSATYFICDTIHLNSLLHETYPAFMSITFYLYVGHLFYYHILRIRDSAGELTRVERRCYRRYMNIGQPEAWPVPAPLLAILNSYGIITPPSKYHGKIIPKLADLSGLAHGTNTCLERLYGCPGLGRLPIIPAMQKFVRNFATGTAEDTEDVLHPLADITLTLGAAGPPIVARNSFCNIANSDNTANAFQVLAFSSGWNLPTETGHDLPNADFALKRSLLNRLRIPDVPENTPIPDLETFLGFADGRSDAWMKSLLSCASAVCRFFPNSATLEQVDTNSVEEFATQVIWTKPIARTRVADRWFRGRSTWKFSFEGKVNTETSGMMYKAAASASPNAVFDARVNPSGHANSFANQHEGPYFANVGGEISVPLKLVETASQVDPVENLRQYIEQHMYDNLGGRSRS